MRFPRWTNRGRGWTPIRPEEFEQERQRLYPRHLPKRVRFVFELRLRFTAFDEADALLKAKAVTEQGQTLVPDLVMIDAAPDKPQHAQRRRIGDPPSED